MHNYVYPSVMKIGIIGATGYTGVELVRLISSHPDLELTYLAAGASAGQSLSSSWGGLTGLIDLPVERFEPSEAAARCDAVFLALPHERSGQVAPRLAEAGLTVVDLSAAFRLDAAAFERFYGLKRHPAPAVYGLPEKNRAQLPGARLIANPGCFPTAVSLAAMPLAPRTDWLIANCLTGVSGAGRSPGPRNRYCEVADSVSAYGVSGAHRHNPELDHLGVPVTFTPHLVPMSRGMLATVTCRADLSAAAARGLFEEAYADCPLVVLRDTPPATADARGSARAHVFVDVDDGVVTAICAIDNLLKGASGQAVQNLNLALGLPETAGLPLFPLLP